MACGPTRAGFRLGALMTLPVLPGVIVFGLAVGALSAQKGLSLVETLALTGLLYGGSSQIVAYQIWPEVWTPASLLAVVGAIAVVNLRMMLMGAALRPWLQNLPGSTIYGGFVMLTDVNWALSVAYQARGGRDFGMFLGAGVAAWIVWVASVIPGWLMVGLVADPKRYGLDMMMVVMFSAMSAPVLQRARRLAPFAAAGVVGLAVGALVEGFWFILAGALAGALVGAGAADE